jgi:lipopolysaccharide transport protein LptA
MKKIFFILFILSLSSLSLAKEESGKAKGFAFVITDNKGNKKATIRGEKAIFLKNGLIELKGVEAVLHRQEEVVIKTKETVFNPTSNIVTTSKFIEIASPSMKVSGIGALWNSLSEEVTINKDVETILYGKKEKNTTVTSQAEMKVFFDKKKAVFNKNVVMENGEGKITADKAEFFFDSKEEKEESDLKKMNAFGNVKILYDGKIAGSEKAEYFAKEGKLILTEDPQIRQNNSLYTAEKITIFSEGDKVEFEPNAQLIIN